MDTSRLLVCGGRRYNDAARLRHVLDSLADNHGLPKVVMTGACRGADQLAQRWAEERGIPVKRFPADWGKHNRAAGPIRNIQMIREGRPTLVVAFPGGGGTDNLVDHADRAGVPWIRMLEEDDG